MHGPFLIVMMIQTLLTFFPECCTASTATRHGDP